MSSNYSNIVTVQSCCHLHKQQFTFSENVLQDNEKEALLKRNRTIKLKISSTKNFSLDYRGRFDVNQNIP